MHYIGLSYFIHLFVYVLKLTIFLFMGSCAVLITEATLSLFMGPCAVLITEATTLYLCGCAMHGTYYILFLA